MNERDCPVFFSLDCHFVLQTIFLPSLHQGLTIDGNKHISSKKHDRQIVFGLQIVLDTCTTHLHDL